MAHRCVELGDFLKRQPAENRIDVNFHEVGGIATGAVAR